MCLRSVDVIASVGYRCRDDTACMFELQWLLHISVPCQWLQCRRPETTPVTAQKTTLLRRKRAEFCQPSQGCCHKHSQPIMTQPRALPCSQRCTASRQTHFLMLQYTQLTQMKRRNHARSIHGAVQR